MVTDNYLPQVNHNKSELIKKVSEKFFAFLIDLIPKGKEIIFATKTTTPHFLHLKELIFEQKKQIIFYLFSWEINSLFPQPA